MRHARAHVFAGQGAGHMQAEEPRVGLHIGHASTVVVQPIDGQHQVGTWMKQGHASSSDQ
jgi:hypothetical protein